MAKINIEESVFVGEKSYFKGTAFVPDELEDEILEAVEIEKARLKGGEKAVIGDSLEPAQREDNNQIRDKKKGK